MMGWYVGDHMSGWGWVGMALSTVLFIGLLVLGGLLLVRVAQQPERPLTPPSPHQLLAERYASSATDEYESARWILSDIHLREIAAQTFLLTYTLDQAGRITRRLTVWQRGQDDGWRALFHQGTIAPQGTADPA